MLAPQCPHLRRPASGAREAIARVGAAFGLLMARRFATRSNAPASMIAGTATAIHSGWGRSLWLRESRRLKQKQPA